MRQYGHEQIEAEGGRDGQGTVISICESNRQRRLQDAAIPRITPRAKKRKRVERQETKPAQPSTKHPRIKKSRPIGKPALGDLKSRGRSERTRTGKPVQEPEVVQNDPNCLSDTEDTAFDAESITTASRQGSRSLVSKFNIMNLLMDILNALFGEISPGVSLEVANILDKPTSSIGCPKSMELKELVDEKTLCRRYDEVIGSESKGYKNSILEVICQYWLGEAMERVLQERIKSGSGPNETRKRKALTHISDIIAAHISKGKETLRDPGRAARQRR